MDSAIKIKNRATKPVIAVIPSYLLPEHAQLAREMAQKLQDGGVPTFNTAERAACALRNALSYYQLQS